MQHMLGLCGSHFLKIAWFTTKSHKSDKVTKHDNRPLSLLLCVVTVVLLVLHTQQKLASMRWGSSVLLLLAVAS